MSNTTIKLKNSGVTGNVPADLEHGELALNYADSRIYYKNSDGVITYISTSGGGSDSFVTINVENSLIVATSNTDILSFASANNISLKSNAVSKTITIDGSQLTNLINGSFSQANTAYNISIGAYNQANTASSNTIYLQAINDNQNTSIGAVNTLSQSAYNKANDAYTKADTVESHLAANVIYVQSVNNIQNVNIGAANTLAQAAYNQANTASSNTIYLQAINDNQNTSIGAVNTLSQSAFNQANVAFNQANTASSNTIYLQAINDNQNTSIGAVNTYAHAAYDNSNTKFSSSGGTINGTVNISQDLYISGNLHLSGNSTSISSNNITIDSPLIYLANNNPSNLLDIGLVGHFVSGHYQHTGVVRNHNNNRWVFFSNVSSEPTTTVNWNEANLVYDIIQTGGIITPTATINGIELGTYSQQAYNTANAAGVLSVSAYSAANGASTLASAAYLQANGASTLSTAAYVEANGASNLALSAYTSANTAAANTVYIFSVNDTQNTNIGNVNTFTQSAYNTANVGSNFVSSGGTITGDVSVTGNVSAQIVLTDNLYHANGVPWSMSGAGTTANSFVLYNFPLGDYGSVTDPVKDSFGAFITPNYDMKSDPLLLGLVSLDLGTVP